MHTAILNFLDMKKDDFYQVETTVRGRNYITARGWEDLSKMLVLYEEEGSAVEESFVARNSSRRAFTSSFSTVEASF